MYRIAIIMAALLFLAAWAASCKHESLVSDDPGGGGNGGDPGNQPCSPDSVYFTQQVLPILISNCSMSGCHDEASHEDGVILTSYVNIMQTADVRPGRPGSSDLYEVLVTSDDDDRMPRPPQSPLSQEQISTIYNWILQGAKNNSCENSCDTLSVTYTDDIKSVISTKCQGCHSGSNPQGGIDLSSYTGVKARADDGSLWGSVNHLQGYSAMPLNGTKLSDCEISQIRIWLAAGSPNN